MACNWCARGLAFLVELARAKDGREIATEAIAVTRLLKLSLDESDEAINPPGGTA